MHYWWWVGTMKRKQQISAEEKRWVFSFALKEVSEDEERKEFQITITKPFYLFFNIKICIIQKQAPSVVVCFCFCCCCFFKHQSPKLQREKNAITKPILLINVFQQESHCMCVCMCACMCNKYNKYNKYNTVITHMPVHLLISRNFTCWGWDEM